jgi:hypothetical protein
MDKELNQLLFDTFPNLYADRNAPLTKSLVAWGFEVGNGWFLLLWDLSRKLEKIIIDWKTKNPEEENFPRASQMKEKYGVLCFYVTNYLDEFEEPIHEAEKRSTMTCEVCGRSGELMTSGHWLKTLCQEHSLYKKSWGGEEQYKPIKLTQ